MVSVPAKKNAAYTFYVGLYSQSNPAILQANPTLATGDVKVSIDGGAFANLGTLPTVAPASGKQVSVVLTAGEMNGDHIGILFSDAAGSEWCDLLYEIDTSVRTIDDLAFPATSGRSMVVDAAGLVDANTVSAGASGAGVAWGSGAITAASIATDAITAAKIAANAIGASELAADVVNDIWMGTALTEAYATDGAAATPAQLLYQIWAMLAEATVSSTTVTVKKLDGSTTAMTFTLNDAGSPTAISRAS